MTDPRVPRATASSLPAQNGKQAGGDPKIALREFVIEFIKALTTTSIYAEDHPLVRGMVQRPTELFRALELKQGEISFLSDQGDASGADLTVEGYGDGEHSLSQVMRSSMSEHFLAKLKTYFDRNRILNLSIKAGIPDEEFARFVGVMVTRTPDEGNAAWADAEAQFDFSAALARREVVHVSVLLWDDILGYERRLPWRVKVAFGRLRKDLRNLPLFQKATGLELRVAKRQIVQDIIRPLMRPDFLKDLLVHSDLVTSENIDLQSIDLEGEIATCVTDPLVTPLVFEAMGDLDRVKARKHTSDPREREGAEHVEGRLLAVLKRLAARLLGNSDAESYPTLKQLFEHGVLRVAELPPELKQRVLQEAWTAKFLEQPQVHVQRFEAASTPDAVRGFFDSFCLVLPELLAKERYDEFNAVLAVVRKRADDAVFAGVLREKRDDLFSEELLARLDRAVRAARKPTRIELLKVLAFCPNDAVPFLVAILKDCGDAGVRRDACDRAVQLGPRAAVSLKKALQEHAYEWFVARNLLIVLGEIGDVSAAPDVQRFLTHPNAKVREEALVATMRIRKQASEPFLLERLGDTTRSVRKRALHALASVGSRHPRFLGDLETMIASEKGEDDDLQFAAVSVLGLLGNIKLPSGRSAVDTLISLLPGGISFLSLSVFGWRRAALSIEVQAEACRVLGEIGDREAVRALFKAGKAPEAKVAAAARDAIVRIEQRLREGAAQARTASTVDRDPRAS